LLLNPTRVRNFENERESKAVHRGKTTPRLTALLEFSSLPVARSQPSAVTGPYRRLMNQRFPKKAYGQRWQIESVFSILKRNLGSALRPRSYHSQNREIRLRVLTHNLATKKGCKRDAHSPYRIAF